MHGGGIARGSINYILRGFCTRTCRRNGLHPHSRGVSLRRDVSNLEQSQPYGRNVYTENSSDFHEQLGRGVVRHIYSRRSEDNDDN